MAPLLETAALSETGPHDGFSDSGSDGWDDAAGAVAALGGEFGVGLSAAAL